MNVIPLSTQIINIDILVEFVVKNFDAGIISDLDAKGYRDRRFYFELLKVIGNDNSITQHMFYSFAIHDCPKDIVIDLSQHFAVSVLKEGDPTAVIITGTLREIRLCIPEFCTIHKGRDLRYIANAIYMFLWRDGMDFLWRDYNAEKQGDGTFTLSKI